MKVQRVRIPNTGQVSWLVLGDDYLPIQPVSDFLAFLENLERSPNTIRAYAYALKLFWAYLRDTDLDWRTVRLSHLAGFIPWLRQPDPAVLQLQEQEARRSESTINTTLSAVTAFYEFHERIGTIEGSAIFREQVQRQRRYKPFLHHISKGQASRGRIVKLKVPRKHPQTLAESQVNQLVAACPRLRDRFLIRLLADTGMRIGQALGLRHADIHSWDNEICIVPRQQQANGTRAKTLEPYIVHVSADLMALYADYLIEEFADTDSDYVFVNLWDGARGQALRYEAVADLFRRLSAKTGIHVYPHLLRHTHATDLIRHGWDAARVQKRLGHASVQTTINLYTHLDDGDLKAAYQAYEATRKRAS